MPDSSLLQVADRVGGWVFAVVVVTTMLWALFRAIKNGDLVPGSVHNRVAAQNDRQAEALTNLTNAVNLLSQRVEDSMREYPPRRRPV